MNCKLFGEYATLSYEELLNLLIEHKDIYLVTDTKTPNTEDTIKIFNDMVKIAKEKDEKVLDRFIVQIYNEQMFETIMNIYPLKSVLYTLYITNSLNKDILNFCKKNEIKAVIMSEIRFSKEFVKSLAGIRVNVYVHTINSKTILEELKAKEVYEIYTDYLLPSEIG